MYDTYFLYKPQHVSIACITSIKGYGRELFMPIYLTITNLSFKPQSIFHFSGFLTGIKYPENHI